MEIRLPGTRKQHFLRLTKTRADQRKNQKECKQHSAWLIMTGMEYKKYQDEFPKIAQSMRELELWGVTSSKRDEGRVTVEIHPAPQGFLSSMFAKYIAGEAKFVTDRTEELAQDLEEYGFEVEFS